MTRRLLDAVGTSACVAAVVCSAVAAGLRSFDRALSDWTTDTTHVPTEWVNDFDRWASE